MIKEICSDLSKSVEKCYGELILEPELNIAQIYFDQLCFNLAFSGTKSSPRILSELGQLCPMLQDNANVEMINDNLSKWYSKSLILFQALFIANPIAVESYLILTRHKPTMAVDKQQMLKVADSVPRFTLLPIAPGLGQNDMRKSANRKKSIQASKSRIKPLPIVNLKPSKEPSEGRPTLEKMMRAQPAKASTLAGVLPEALQQKTTSDLFSSASSFLGSYWGGAQTSTSTPPRKN